MGTYTSTSGTPVTADRSGSDSDSWSTLSNFNNSNNSSSAYILAVGKNAYTKWVGVNNFGFSVPSGDTVVGLEWYLFVGSESNYCDIDAAAINIGSGVESASPTTGIGDTMSSYLLGSGGGYIYIGADDELWGKTLTPAIVNSSSFAVYFSAYNTDGSNTRSVYAIEHYNLKVYTTAGGSKFWCPPMGWVLGAFGISQMLDPIMRKTRAGIKRYIQRDGGLILCPSY